MIKKRDILINDLFEIENGIISLEFIYRSDLCPPNEINFGSWNNFYCVKSLCRSFYGLRLGCV